MKTDEEIPGLRDALLAEARERERLQNIELRLETAYHSISANNAKRLELKVKAAAGEAVDVAEIERLARETASVSEGAEVYSAALDLAQRAVADASGTVHTVLDNENLRRLRAAQAEYTRCKTALSDAARAHEAAAAAVGAAERGRSMTSDTARRAYASEIARASSA